jgi:hypothetical protein
MTPLEVLGLLGLVTGVVSGAIGVLLVPGQLVTEPVQTIARPPFVPHARASRAAAYFELCRWWRWSSRGRRDGWCAARRPWTRSTTRARVLGSGRARTKTRRMLWTAR